MVTLVPRLNVELLLGLLMLTLRVVGVGVGVGVGVAVGVGVGVAVGVGVGVGNGDAVPFKAAISTSILQPGSVPPVPAPLYGDHDANR